MSFTSGGRRLSREPAAPKQPKQVCSTDGLVRCFSLPAHPTLSLGHDTKSQPTVMLIPPPPPPLKMEPRHSSPQAWRTGPRHWRRSATLLLMHKRLRATAPGREATGGEQLHVVFALFFGCWVASVWCCCFVLLCLSNLAGRANSAGSPLPASVDDSGPADCPQSSKCRVQSPDRRVQSPDLTQQDSGCAKAAAEPCHASATGFMFL